MGNWDELIKKLWGDELPKKTVMCDDNTCENCRHEDSSPFDEPCYSCYGYKNWEPEHEDSVDALRYGVDVRNNTIAELKKKIDELEKELLADNDVREGYEEIIRAISEQNEEYETKILELTEANKHLAELLDIANERIEIYKNIKDILEERVKNAEKIIEYHKRTNNNSNAMTDAAVALLKAAGYEVTYVGD